MDNPFSVNFAGGRGAQALRVARAQELGRALDALGIGTPRPALALVGGAGGLDAAARDALCPLFAELLVPLVRALGAGVVDGGTNAGVMALMGQAARADAGAGFPLLGVAPESLVDWPGSHNKGADEERAALEPNHTHFLLVPGARWGDESPLLSRAAAALAGGRCGSATLLVNGGEVTWRDVGQSVRAGRPVVAMVGSGRAADALAEALGGGQASSRARKLAESGLLYAVDPVASPAALSSLLTALLGSRL